MKQPNWPLGLLIGAGIGGAAGWLSHGADPITSPGAVGLASGRPEDAANHSVPAELAEIDPTGPRRPSPGRAEATTTGPSGVADDAGELFSEALLAHAQRELIDGWKRERSDEPKPQIQEEGLGLFREQTLALPTTIGRSLARRTSTAEFAAEDARTGGVFETLARIDNGSPGPLFDVIDSAKIFDQFFQAETGGPTPTA